MSRGSLLLIEDSPAQALRFRLLLERAGYAVEVVGDGGQGWQRVCAALPRLVLLDIDLPTLDGFQVLARLRRGRATRMVPVIMLTNREHISHVERALALGADDYLFKDDAAQLTSAIAQILAQRAAPLRSGDGGVRP